MPITAAQLDHYQSKGWVVVEGVFALDRVEWAAKRGVELAEPETQGSENSVKIDISPDGKERLPRKLDKPFARDAAFGRMVFESELPELIKQITGAEPLFFADQLFLKPPRHGSAKAYHQDNAYFRLHPDDHVITAWIALDDVDEANGCLRYIDGSHLGPILPCEPVPGRTHDLTPDPALIDLTRESLAPVKKGGVVFHHAKALHCSGPNTSERWRRGYATHWVAADVTPEQGQIELSYYQKPELFAGWGEKYARNAPKALSAIG